MNRMRKIAVMTQLIEMLRDKQSWCGETHVQKAIYFAQSVAGIGLGYDFILYKHGPFSFDLRDELTALRAEGIVHLEARYPYGARIAPTEQSMDIRGRYRKTLRECNGKMQFVADKLGGKDVVYLERLGTALFFSQNLKKETGDEEVAGQITKMKPHISWRDALDAIREVREIEAEAQELFPS